MEYQILKTEQKALEINLHEGIYGTFAEIGAGQEVARNFFQAGAAANTIAKTMSAYDKTYSDAIYGSETSGRYVCESRLYKMLEHEWNLLDERLKTIKPDTNFFVFADTVTTINYSKTVKGHGWLGLRFQLTPGTPPNEVVIHCKLEDNDIKLQQEAVGVLGVNLLYAVYYHKDNPRVLVKSLLDGLQGRLTVDLLRIKGPDFQHFDNRLTTFYLVKYGLTELAIFDENRKGIHASEFLYKKSLMVVRGNFRPPTNVTLDVFKTGFEQFKNEPYIDPNLSYIIAELTLDYLKDVNSGVIKPDTAGKAEAELMNFMTPIEKMMFKKAIEASSLNKESIKERLQPLIDLFSKQASDKAETISNLNSEKNQLEKDSRSSAAPTSFLKEIAVIEQAIERLDRPTLEFRNKME